MHFISAVFGFIAFFIIIKGFIDMHKKIKDKIYFDKIVSSDRENTEFKIGHNRVILYPYSVMKHEYRTGQWYVTDGGVWFEVPDSLMLATTGGKLKIRKASGYVLSGRYPEIFVQSGEVDFENKVLKGNNILYDDLKKQVDTLSINYHRIPYIILQDEQARYKIDRFFSTAHSQEKFPVEWVIVKKK